jgi:ABC-type transporter Mla subunit MlaD
MIESNSQDRIEQVQEARMAKKRRRTATGAERTATGPELESKISGFAQDIGQLLGTARNKAERWLSQRERIITDLTQLRDAANGYLSQLSGAGASIANLVTRRGRKARGGASASRKKSRKTYTLSAEARERIAAAQRKRWAKVKRAKKSGKGRKTATAGGHDMGNA